MRLLRESEETTQAQDLTSLKNCITAAQDALQAVIAECEKCGMDKGKLDNAVTSLGEFATECDTASNKDNNSNKKTETTNETMKIVRGAHRRQMRR